MNEMNKPKEFDCIEFKRKVQERVYEDIKDKTSQQQIEYFRNRAENGPLGDWWRLIRRRGRGAAESSHSGSEAQAS